MVYQNLTGHLKCVGSVRLIFKLQRRRIRKSSFLENMDHMMGFYGTSDMEYIVDGGKRSKK